MSPLTSSVDAPLPLRRVSQAVGDWIGRLGEIWVEGQIAQFVHRPDAATQFLIVRDVEANISMQVTCSRTALPEQLATGARVVMRARPDFYAERGTLSLRATDIRQVGLGELLARIERLRTVLAAEGLFNAARKRALPSLPNTIGLITGRSSAAERDVVDNTQRRFAGARFVIENAATQGNAAVSEIIEALARLDANPDVDVIVIARGGGGVEDLLPFSNEALLRAVSACRTPVVSAIGHETDRPLLDYVADLAASTPTDAANCIVPDLAAELRQTAENQHRLRTAIQRRLDNELELISGLPERLRRAVRGFIETGRSEQHNAVAQLRGRLDLTLSVAVSENEQLLARVISLSPQAVLDRGYAVLWNAAGALIKTPRQLQRNEPLHVRVGDGEFEVVVTGGALNE